MVRKCKEDSWGKWVFIEMGVRLAFFERFASADYRNSPLAAPNKGNVSQNSSQGPLEIQEAINMYLKTTFVCLRRYILISTVSQSFLFGHIKIHFNEEMYLKLST